MKWFLFSLKFASAMFDMYYIRKANLERIQDVETYQSVQYTFLTLFGFFCFYAPVFYEHLSLQFNKKLIFSSFLMNSTVCSIEFSNHATTGSVGCCHNRPSSRCSVLVTDNGVANGTNISCVKWTCKCSLHPYFRYLKKLFI